MSSSGETRAYGRFCRHHIHGFVFNCCIPAFVMIKPARSRPVNAPSRFFYGWWIVGAAFLNLFFTTGVIYYGFPVFYPAFVAFLGFTRAQVTQGFLLGALVVGLPFGLFAGTLIDRVGARAVILSGVGLIGLPLILMGRMTHFWQYEFLCIAEVVGYTLAGPIANQVLIAQWFRVRRGQAMGYAYLGLGLGGVVSPLAANFLIRRFGWRTALEIGGTLMLAVLFPVGFWVTRSTPSEMGLLPDGADAEDAKSPSESRDEHSGVAAALRSEDFWLILAGATLILSSVNAVIQHFILFLRDQGYSIRTASDFLSALLVSSLGGRVLVGYIADRFRKKNTMALFYLVLGASIPLLYLARQPIAAFAFAVTFGFSMGADYMLIPLVTADRFGLASLGKLLALIIMGYTIGQWIAPWMAGRIFDTYHSYRLAWAIFTGAGLLGAAAIYAVSSSPISSVRFSGSTPK
jgi:MFS transporter, OFA family, oxalate/formate antiporter